LIEAVLFDLDGTLLDRRATFRRHLDRQLSRHPGVFRPKEDFEAHFPEKCIPLPNVHETLRECRRPAPPMWATTPSPM
jgi:FMN phosphatase YigB (HAD superfamily)